MARRPVEPVLWLLFSAGGVASALFLPALVVLFAFALPLGWVDGGGREGLLGLVGHPLVALVLVGVCVLSLFHWAQRFRYMLVDGLLLQRHRRPIDAGVYALALLGSVAAVVVLWQAVSARGG
ncbi:fumarate reductase subunit D [Terrabacter terrigena]|uniref:Fumarate reductase subunit D n=1 Tax=Terrabacter terrigena TaxID=574718 RepID=A0ABW3N0J7_9MICO